MLEDAEVTKEALRELGEFGMGAGLRRSEIPGFIKLLDTAWTPDTGLVTTTFKLKRRVVKERYQGEIDRMYGDPAV